MANFRGSYDYSIDAKGRVNIPARFRKALSPEAEETFVIVRGPGKGPEEDCLRAYPMDVWVKYESELSARPETEENLWYIRQLRSNLTESALDVQGRVMIPAALMKVAGLSKNVTLVGMVAYIEIWDTERYQQYLDSGGDFKTAYFKSVEAGLAGR